MGIVAFSQDASHLALGAFATFCAILLWSRTRDLAWTFVIIGAIVSYADIVLATLRGFGILGEDLLSYRGVPGPADRPGQPAAAVLGDRVPARRLAEADALSMAPIRVIPARDEANIEQKLVTLLLAAVQEKPDLIISVFAGTPAFGAYRLLVERARSELVDFSRVRFVVFDELLGAREPGAGPFRAVLDERLFIPLGIPADNVISFSRPATARRRRRASPASSPFPGIDIALLSVDSRGHIGFHVTGSNLESTAGIVHVENAQRWEAARGILPRARRPVPGPRASFSLPRGATSRRSSSASRREPSIPRSPSRCSSGTGTSC